MTMVIPNYKLFNGHHPIEIGNGYLSSGVNSSFPSVHFENSYRRLSFLSDFQSWILEPLFELWATEGLVNDDYSFLLHDNGYVL